MENDTDTTRDIERDYIVTLEVQMIIAAPDAGHARLDALERVDEMISKATYCHDPMNGRVVVSVEEVPDSALPSAEAMLTDLLREWM